MTREEAFEVLHAMCMEVEDAEYQEFQRREFHDDPAGAKQIKDWIDAKKKEIDDFKEKHHDLLWPED